MSSPPPKLSDLISFPSAFTFRVMAEAGPDLEARCQQALTAALGQPASGVESRPSSAGRYQAVRLTATVATPDEVYAVYAALQRVEGVRMVL
jgi:putative lipoic acid-binding regulatory protein